jgi:hypothetical protein
MAVCFPSSGCTASTTSKRLRRRVFRVRFVDDLPYFALATVQAGMNDSGCTTRVARGDRIEWLERRPPAIEARSRFEMPDRAA